jgi:hypothetical protein
MPDEPPTPPGPSADGRTNGRTGEGRGKGQTGEGGRGRTREGRGKGGGGGPDGAGAGTGRPDGRRADRGGRQEGGTP